MHLQPKARAALLAAFHAPGHALRRTRGGFATRPAQVTTSGPVQVEAFTRRVVNWLDEAALVDFDDSRFPSCVTLNKRGIALAEQLVAEAKAPKAVRA